MKSGKIVRTVEVHADLLMVAKEMSKSFHYAANHDDYFHMCTESMCLSNKQIINKAEGK